MALADLGNTTFHFGRHVELDWPGGEIRTVIARIVNEAAATMAAEGIANAKTHHPGWQNDTSKAQTSIRRLPTERGVIEWGSRTRNARYVGLLEERRGRFIQRAHQRAVRNLARNVRTMARPGGDSIVRGRRARYLAQARARDRQAKAQAQSRERFERVEGPAPERGRVNLFPSIPTAAVGWADQ